MEKKNQKRRRARQKCLYAAAAILVCLAVLELAARAYSAIRYRRPRFWFSYGFVGPTPAGQPDGPTRQAPALSREAPVVMMNPESELMTIVRSDGTHEERLAEDLQTPEARPQVGVNRDVSGYILRIAGREAYINSYGLRGPEFPQKKPPGCYRVVVLGGSATWGDRNDDEHTHPALLQKTFQANGLEHVQVINAGWPRYDSSCYVRLLGKVTRLDPDLVILFDAWNDIMPVIRTSVSGQTRLAFDLTTSLVKRSVLALKMAELVFSVRRNGRGLPADADARESGGIPYAEHPVFRKYKRNVVHVIEEFRSRDTMLLFVKFPHNIGCLQVPDVAAAAAMRRATETVYAINESLVQQYSIPICDCESPFQAAGKAGLFIRGDTMHLSDLGNERVARLLFESIRANFDVGQTDRTAERSKGE